MTSAAAAKWSQDHRHVFISVSIPGASASQDPQYTLAAEGGIQLEVNGRAFEQQLCGPIDPEHPNTSVTYKPNSVEVMKFTLPPGMGSWPYGYVGLRWVCGSTREQCGTVLAIGNTIISRQLTILTTISLASKSSCNN